MGCWNETCMLSHLQILAGDKVKLILLVSNTKEPETRPCYYNENYSPIALPIDAEYNDYGGVENVKLPQYTDKLFTELKFMDKEGNPYEYTNVEELVDRIGDGLYLDHRRLAYEFVHAELYDILVNDFKKRKPYGKKETIFELHWKRNQELKNDIIQYNSFDETDKDSKAMVGHMVHQLKIMKKFCSTDFGYSFPETFFTKGCLTESNIDVFMAEYTDYLMFAKSLSFGRYGYLSYSGAGGQDRDVRVQKLVAKFVLEHSRIKDEDGHEVYSEDETIFWFEDTI